MASRVMNNIDTFLKLVDGGRKMFCGVDQLLGGFVKDEDLGLLDERACDSHALLLPAGESDAAFADLGLVALRQGFDGAVYLCHFQHCTILSKVVCGLAISRLS